MEVSEKLPKTTSETFDFRDYKKITVGPKGPHFYSTVTLLARLRGLSTSYPFKSAI